MTRSVNSVLTNREFKLPEDGMYQIAPVGEFFHAPTGFTEVIDAASVLAMVNAFKVESSAPNFAGLLVDFDHFSNDTSKPSEAAGWITTLEQREDGLWGNIRWSSAGQEAVSGGVYRMLSPVWRMDQCEIIGENRLRPMRLNNAAVTNDPNLRGMVPLSNRADSAGGPPYSWDQVKWAFANLPEDKALEWAKKGKAAGLSHSDILCGLMNACDEQDLHKRLVNGGGPAKNRKEEQHMKEALLKMLGLPADTADEAALAKAQEIVNRAAAADALEADKTTLTNRVKELEAADLARLVEADMVEFAPVIANKDDVKAMLIANREGTRKLLAGLATKQTPARKPLLNRADTDTPAAEDAAIPSDTEIDAYVKNHPKCSRTTAFTILRNRATKNNKG